MTRTPATGGSSSGRPGKRWSASATRRRRSSSSRPTSTRSTRSAGDGPLYADGSDRRRVARRREDQAGDPVLARAHRAASWTRPRPRARADAVVRGRGLQRPARRLGRRRLGRRRRRGRPVWTCLRHGAATRRCDPAGPRTTSHGSTTCCAGTRSMPWSTSRPRTGSSSTAAPPGRVRDVSQGPVEFLVATGQPRADPRHPARRV